MNEEHYRKAWEELKQDAITQIQQIKENSMKTFADTHFSIRRNPAGIMGKIDLGNGFEISIIMHEYSYGGTQGLWEIACFDKNEQVDLECLGHDVVGYLTFTELETKIREIQEELNNNNFNNKPCFLLS